MASNKNYKVVVIENPLLDITVNDDSNALHDKYKLEHGLACLVSEATMGIHDEIFQMEGKETTPGGAALNSARVAAHCLKNMGVNNEVAYVGCIAKDAAGDILVETLEKAGMHGEFAITTEEGTGRCAVLTHNKERTMCANIGASAKYPTSHFETHQDLFKNAGMIYTTGFFITSNNEALNKVCKTAVENNVPLAFNIAAPFLLQFCKDQVFECLKHASFVFCNEDEANTYGALFDIPKDDFDAIAKHISERETADAGIKRHAIVTVGSRPIRWAHNGEVKHFEIDPIPKEEIVDTNGCGDSFVGGFLSKRCQGASIEESIQHGIHMSSIVIKRAGCTFE